MNDLFVLTDYLDLVTETHEPLKQTQRIKYISFDVSTNFLIFGATSGSLYLFYRKPSCKFLHLVPNKYGPVNLLSISPNEKYIAFATLKGTICVYSINLNPNSAPHVIAANSGDAETMVTSLHWSADERSFYYGDKKGGVHLITLNFFMGRSLLNISIHPMLYLETPIVQISDFDSLLLVSNYTKCILCNTEYEEFKQIGNRPRDGYYGACFSISSDEEVYPSRIYCARPGTRLWECDFEGNVLQTHQFKQSLARPPVKIFKADDLLQNCNNDDEESQIEYSPQTLQFSKLQTIMDNELILTFTDSGIYIFDPRISAVVLWCDEFERIADCKVIRDEIFVFMSTGITAAIRLVPMHSYAIDLVHRQKLLDAVYLLKTNLKYFAEKAKEQSDLTILNDIKRFLIKTNQYEMLNDLSVIFDSITHRETEISKAKRLESGIYVLENAFCDNLKLVGSGGIKQQNQQTIGSGNDKHIKDALLTVTGKFGKNIIKYKFNIFSADEQNSYVKDLIPAVNRERQIPFQEINEQLFPTDDEIVCNRITTPGRNTNYKQLKSELLSEYIVSEEEKTIRNLYIVFKSSKISKLNFLERYRLVFDKYDSREIINLLDKLEKMMIENGDGELDARRNCFEMYFNYLNPELIWEFDHISLEFIIEGYMLINTSDNLQVCENCEFPVRYDNCKHQFHDLGESLIKFLWSRNDRERIYNIIKTVPTSVDVLCRFYMQENRMEQVIPLIISFGDQKLYEEAAKLFEYKSWDKFFELYTGALNGNVNCYNCDNLLVFQPDENFFYTWNSFLNVALQYINAYDILDLIIKYSNFMPNDAIDRDFFLKCLIKD